MNSVGTADTLLTISDLHCNSTVGLAPPQGARLPGGQRILPSHVQLWQWECWLETIRRTKLAHQRNQGKLIVHMNGDMVEGLDHHDTVETMARVEEAQQYIAEEVLGPLLDLRPDRILIVRGTPAHVGKGASSEELLGRWIKADKDPDTECWSRHQLWLKIRNTLVEAQHHGKGLPKDNRNRQAGAVRLAFRIREDCDLKGQEKPQLVFRSHLHLHADSGDAHPHTRAIFTPAFQLKTEFGFRVDDSAIPADLGGVITSIRDDGYSIEKVLFTPKKPTTVMV